MGVLSTRIPPLRLPRRPGRRWHGWRRGAWRQRGTAVVAPVAMSDGMAGGGNSGAARGRGKMAGRVSLWLSTVSEASETSRSNYAVVRPSETRIAACSP